MQFQENQHVIYRGEKHRVLSQQSENYVRITSRTDLDYSFAVHKSLLTLVEAKAARPEVLKKLDASVEVARNALRLATDWQTLYSLLQRSGYFRNELRTYMSKNRRRAERGGNFGMLKGIMIAKVAAVVRAQGVTA